MAEEMKDEMEGIEAVGGGFLEQEPSKMEKMEVSAQTTTKGIRHLPRPMSSWWSSNIPASLSCT